MLGFLATITGLATLAWDPMRRLWRWMPYDSDTIIVPNPLKAPYQSVIVDMKLDHKVAFKCTRACVCSAFLFRLGETGSQEMSSEVRCKFTGVSNPYNLVFKTRDGCRIRFDTGQGLSRCDGYPVVLSDTPHQPIPTKFVKNEKDVLANVALLGESFVQIASSVPKYLFGVKAHTYLEFMIARPPQGEHVISSPVKVFNAQRLFLQCVNRCECVFFSNSVTRDETSDLVQEKLISSRKCGLRNTLTRSGIKRVLTNVKVGFQKLVSKKEWADDDNPDCKVRFDLVRGLERCEVSFTERNKEIDLVQKTANSKVMIPIAIPVQTSGRKSLEMELVEIPRVQRLVENPLFQSIPPGPPPLDVNGPPLVEHVLPLDVNVPPPLVENVLPLDVNVPPPLVENGSPLSLVVNGESSGPHDASANPIHKSDSESSILSDISTSSTASTSSESMDESEGIHTSSQSEEGLGLRPSEDNIQETNPHSQSGDGIEMVPLSKVKSKHVYSKSSNGVSEPSLRVKSEGIFPLPNVQFDEIPQLPNAKSSGIEVIDIDLPSKATKRMHSRSSLISRTFNQGTYL